MPCRPKEFPSLQTFEGVLGQIANLVLSVSKASRLCELGAVFSGGGSEGISLTIK